MSFEEDAVRRSNRPQFLALHPLVYRLLLASAAGVFLSAWLFFSHDGYTAFQLAVVLAFLVMFVGVPWVMARMTAKRRAAEAAPSFAEWREGDFVTWTGPLPAGQAALMILTAPAAAVLGLFAISAIAYMAATGVL